MEERQLVTDWSKRPVDLIYPKGHVLKTQGKCPTCGKDITQDMIDSFEPVEWREYKISGICKACQLKVFGTQNYDRDTL